MDEPISKIDIPKSIYNLMENGICPICKIPMRKNNGKESHSKAKKILCEELLREKLNEMGHPVERSTAKIGDKIVEIDARLMKKDDADKLKKETEANSRFSFREN